MAFLLAPVDARFVAILEEARGSGTGFTPVANALALPAGALRRSADRMPLESPSYPGERFDLAYSLAYTQIGGTEAAQRRPNPYDSQSVRDVYVTLSIGFVYGVALSNFVSPWPLSQEVVTDSVRDFTLRATSITDEVVLALEFPELFSDTTTDPVLIECTRLDLSTCDDTGALDGRLISRTPLRVRIARAQGTHYYP